VLLAEEEDRTVSNSPLHVCVKGVYNVSACLKCKREFQQTKADKFCWSMTCQQHSNLRPAVKLIKLQANPTIPMHSKHNQ